MTIPILSSLLKIKRERNRFITQTQKDMSITNLKI